MNSESLAPGCILTVTCGTHPLSLYNQESGETSAALIEASCPELHGCLIPSFHALLQGSQLPAKGGWRARIRAGELRSAMFDSLRLGQPKGRLHRQPRPWAKTPPLLQGMYE